MTGRQRKPTQTDRVEAMLRANPAGVTNAQFAAEGILRYAARLEELRKDRGLSIETIRESAGTFRYRLTDPALASAPETATSAPDSLRGVSGAGERGADEPSLFEPPERPSYMDVDAFEDAA